MNLRPLSDHPLNPNNGCRYPEGILGQTLGIDLLIWILLRQLHHHLSRYSDNLPGQEDVLQPEGLDLLSVFRFHFAIHLGEQEQNLSHHHRPKDRLVRPKGFELQAANRHILLGFFDVILTIDPFPGITRCLAQGKIRETAAGRCAISGHLVLLTQFKLAALLIRSQAFRKDRISRSPYRREGISPWTTPPRPLS